MAADIALDHTVVASKDAIWCDLKGEAVVLHLASGIYFGLAGAAVEIWQFIESPRTVSEVVDHLRAGFDVSVDVCRATTLAFLAELAQHGLVVVEKHVAAV